MNENDIITYKHSILNNKKQKRCFEKCVTENIVKIQNFINLLKDTDFKSNCNKHILKVLINECSKQETFFENRLIPDYWIRLPNG